MAFLETVEIGTVFVTLVFEFFEGEKLDRVMNKAGKNKETFDW